MIAFSLFLFSDHFDSNVNYFVLPKEHSKEIKIKQREIRMSQSSRDDALIQNGTNTMEKRKVESFEMFLSCHGLLPRHQSISSQTGMKIENEKDSNSFPNSKFRGCDWVKNTRTCRILNQRLLALFRTRTHRTSAMSDNCPFRAAPAPRHRADIPSQGRHHPHHEPQWSYPILCHAEQDDPVSNF